MTRWMRWHCPNQDTELESRAMAVWDQARYLSVMEAPHNIELNIYKWAGKKRFISWMPERGSRSPTFQTGSFNHCTRLPPKYHTECCF